MDSTLKARSDSAAALRAADERAHRILVASVDSAIEEHKRLNRQKFRTTGGLPLVLTIGAELSNAFNFSQTKVSPGIAVTVIGAGLSYGRRFHSTFAIQSQLTQGATVREFRTCQLVRTAIAGEPIATAPSGDTCTPSELVGDTTVSDLLITDSIRFQTADVWRAFAQGRIEYGDSVGIRVGPVFGLGIQSNPNNLTDPRQQQLKILGLFGGGIRQIESDGYESFSFEVVYGAVQNYFQQDVLGPAGLDGRPTIVTNPGPPRRTKQWQAFLTLRPIQSFRIRLISTLGAPAPDAPGQPPVPDLARIAFMTDRRLSDIVTALVGGQKREPDRAPADSSELPEAGIPLATADTARTERMDSALVLLARARSDSAIRAERDSMLAAAKVTTDSILATASNRAVSLAADSAAAVRVNAERQADSVTTAAQTKADSIVRVATARADSTLNAARALLEEEFRKRIVDSTAIDGPTGASPKQSAPF